MSRCVIGAGHGTSRSPYRQAGAIRFRSSVWMILGVIPRGSLSAVLPDEGELFPAAPVASTEVASDVCEATVGPCVISVLRDRDDVVERRAHWVWPSQRLVDWSAADTAGPSVAFEDLFTGEDLDLRFKFACASSCVLVREGLRVELPLRRLTLSSALGIDAPLVCPLLLSVLAVWPLPCLRLVLALDGVLGSVRARLAPGSQTIGLAPIPVELCQWFRFLACGATFGRLGHASKVVMRV